MTSRIGVALLVEDKNSFNYCRNLSYRVYEATGNRRALQQPPHITLKGPFVVKQAKDINILVTELENTVQRSLPLEITLDGISSFKDSVLYLKIENQDDLLELHSVVSKVVENLYGEGQDHHENNTYVPHVTIGYQLSESEFSSAIKSIADFKDKVITFSSASIAILGEVEQDNWQVLKII